MNLRDYLFKKRMTIVEFSQIVNYDRIYISALKNGRHYPGRKCREIILKATNGEVTEYPSAKEQEEEKIKQIQHDNEGYSIA